MALLLVASSMQEGVLPKFKGIDTHGDGVVQQEEELASFFVDASDKEKKHATKLFQAHDANGNNVFSKDAFQAHDADGNKGLSDAESVSELETEAAATAAEQDETEACGAQTLTGYPPWPF